MKTLLSCEIPNDRTDSADLQGVLTRCIDSARGYSQAAARMRDPDLSAMLREVAARRQGVARELAGLIRRQGGEAEQRASVAGTLRRGWLALHRTIAGEPLRSVAAECIRCEELLLSALEHALDSQEVTHRHAEALRKAREDVTETIRAFRDTVRVPFPEFRRESHRAAKSSPSTRGKMEVVAKGSGPHAGAINVRS